MRLNPSRNQPESDFTWAALPSPKLAYQTLFAETATFPSPSATLTGEEYLSTTYLVLLHRDDIPEPDNGPHHLTIAVMYSEALHTTGRRTPLS